jgi:hypothetical protein
MMRALAMIFFALTNFYLLAVMLMFQRVVYPAFRLVPHEGFPAYYTSFTSNIALVVVVPEFLALLSAMPLFFWRDESLGAWIAWVALGAGILYMAITFGLHLPVHRALANGDNGPSVVDALLSTNGARTIVQALKCVFVCWVLFRLQSARAFK